MASTQDSWSNISPEIVELFLGLLHAHVDRVRFAAVCPQWRSAAQHVRLPPPPPLLALKVGDIFYSMPRGEPLHFAGYKNGFATTCGKWLVYRRFRKLLMVDPFSGATMTLPEPSRVYLPGEHGCVDPDSFSYDDHDDSTDEFEDSEDSHDSSDEGDSEGGFVPSRVLLPDEDMVGDSRDSHDSVDDGEDYEGSYDSVDEGDSVDDGEGCEGSHDSADEDDFNEDGSVYTDDSELLMDIKSFKVTKLIECSPNLFVALFQGRGFSRIAVCRPGGSKWSVAWGMSSLGISDMAFYHGKLYVVNYYEDLLALEISVNDETGDPWVSQIGRVINVNRFDNKLDLLRMLYLVESCGSLLLVRRRIFHKHVHGKGKIHTFAGPCEPNVWILEADFGRSQWVKVTTLANDQALFLGPCSRSICMPPSDSPGNRVWFLDDYKDFYFWVEYYNSTCGTSSMANPKPFSPLPMISWMGYHRNAGAAWLFPAN